MVQRDRQRLSQMSLIKQEFRTKCQKMDVDLLSNDFFFDQSWFGWNNASNEVDDYNFFEIERAAKHIAVILDKICFDKERGWHFSRENILKSIQQENKCGDYSDANDTADQSAQLSETVVPKRCVTFANEVKQYDYNGHISVLPREESIQIQKTSLRKELEIKYRTELKEINSQRRLIDGQLTYLECPERLSSLAFLTSNVASMRSTLNSLNSISTRLYEDLPERESESRFSQIDKELEATEKQIENGERILNTLAELQDKLTLKAIQHRQLQEKVRQRICELLGPHLTDWYERKSAIKNKIEQTKSIFGRGMEGFVICKDEFKGNEDSPDDSAMSDHKENMQNSDNHDIFLNANHDQIGLSLEKLLMMLNQSNQNIVEFNKHVEDQIVEYTKLETLLHLHPWNLWKKIIGLSHRKETKSMVDKSKTEKRKSTLIQGHSKTFNSLHKTLIGQKTMQNDTTVYKDLLDRVVLMEAVIKNIKRKQNLKRKTIEKEKEVSPKKETCGVLQTTIDGLQTKEENLINLWNTMMNQLKDMNITKELTDIVNSRTYIKQNKTNFRSFLEVLSMKIKPYLLQHHHQLDSETDMIKNEIITIKKRLRKLQEVMNLFQVLWNHEVVQLH